MIYKFYNLSRSFLIFNYVPLVYIFINLIYISIILQRSSGINYLIDNNESYGIIREVLVRKDFGWLNGFGLFDESTSNLGADHPVVYTHSGNSPRFIPLVLVLLGFQDPLLIYYFSVLIVSSVILFTLYKFLSLFFSKFTVNVTVCLFVLNYFSFTQGQFQIYQSFRYMNFLIFLYIILKLLFVNKLSKFHILSLSASTFLIALGDLTFSFIVLLFYVFFYISFRNRIKSYISRVFLLSWLSGTCLLIFQLLKYYGINGLVQDIEQTFKLRSFGSVDAYENAILFSINTNTVNLYANNTGVYGFYDFFSRLSSEFLLNFELLDILTLLGVAFLFFYTLWNYISNKTLRSFTELVICTFIFINYLLIFKITYSNDVFWFSINNDVVFFNFFTSINVSNLIWILPCLIGFFIVKLYFKLTLLFIFRILMFLSICAYFLSTLDESFTYSYMINSIIIFSVIVYLILLSPKFYQALMSDKSYSVLIKVAGFYIISVSLVNFILPGYFKNAYFSHNYFLFVVFNYTFIAISISIILLPIQKFPNNQIFVSSLTAILLTLLMLKTLWVNYDHHKLLKSNRFQGVISFLQQNNLSDSGFVSDNYPGFISLFANTWGHWDSAYMQKRYDVGCKLAFDRRANNNRTIRVDKNIFPKYYISAPPINNLQVPYYIKNGESIKIAWLAQLKNNMLPGDKIIFEETDSLTGSLIIELSPCT
jgi:hypothetical protein